jgi:hypothetical protein
MKTCGTCKHWYRAGEYRWGLCASPLPPWVEELDERPHGGPIFSDSDMAERCDVFEEKREMREEEE